MDSIVAKFGVNSISDQGNVVNFTLGAVYSSDPKSENKSFSDSTPSGYLNLGIDKSKPAVGFLEMGDVVYITIVKAEKNPWKYLQDSKPWPSDAVVELSYGDYADKLTVTVKEVTKEMKKEFEAVGRRAPYQIYNKEDGTELILGKDSHGNEGADFGQYTHWRYHPDFVEMISARIRQGSTWVNPLYKRIS